MSKVLVNGLNVRAGPSTNSQKVAYYNTGQIINSRNLVVENEGRFWLRYKGGSGNQRYVCMWENGKYFVDVPSHIPGPRPEGGGPQPSHSETDWELVAYYHCSKFCGNSALITESGY